MNEGVEITLETTLRGRLARTLLHESEKRRLKPVELLALIVENVLNDNIVAAVVDE